MDEMTGSTDGSIVGKRAAGEAAIAGLPRELIALAQGGSGVAIAACGNDGRPVLGLGVGCRVIGEHRFRVILGRRANEVLLSALKDGNMVAVTFTATRDHTSFQVKSSVASLRDCCSDDFPEVDRQNALFQDGLVEIGYSRRQAAGYSSYDHDDLVALEFVPEQVFTQTPGPGAGAEIS
ncbi:hypothetical protein [Defluviimonas sp. WL0075]|uniref:Pyridoxamine 5'-phosphate oxidase putative domain-containing protein n=1 Tax=Albidovulum sediminicola TaxID=2984331 RepID=A0ABT2Z660_9RHOB|nr:hypothetical protein [Defluviimonas sp. WL0075]MCV2866639.1 hypothetical protein [Defluviimonas sp. WL0075]